MTTYTQGYRDGLEAAAKECETVDYYVVKCMGAELRNLPVPESTQPSVEEILNGIDKTETESPDGWWETSVGAEFGAKKLTELKAALRYGRQPVSVEDVAWPENIVADRHETTGKWVLWYLTDEQAAHAKAAMRACGLKVD